MIVDNRKIIKHANELVFNQLLEVENDVAIHIRVEPAKKEGDTLSLFMGGVFLPIISKYNPINEAQTFLQQYDKIKEPEHLLFIGVGLGYHVIQLLKKFPNVNYSIYEPNIHILSAFLAKQNLAGVKAKLINIFTDKEQIHNFSDFVKNFISKGEIIRWIVTNKLYTTQITHFDEAVAEVLKSEQYSLRVKAAYQQRWQINGIINFPKLIKTPFLFDLDVSLLENKPVIIVAAGPSLSFDMHLLKEIKDKKKAYIFAVGSAINALIEHDIIPDAFVSFDPQVINQNVVLKVKEKNIPIPMLFGSTIGFETLPNYPGPMFHFIVGQETISRYLLDLQPDKILSDKPSVAVMAFEICIKFNMGPIILAGQNCAYLDNKRYAKGIEYTHISSEVEKNDEQVEVESVDGDIIYTNSSYLAVKSNFEHYIDHYKLENVYNTTQRGANIEGAPYVELEELLKARLVENNIVNYNWDYSGINYDIKEIKKRYQKLENSFDELLIYVNKIDVVMAEIIEKHNKKIYKNLNTLLLQYDRQYDAIHANTFYKVVIEEMIRVNKEKFLAHSHEVKYAPNDKLKLEKFIEIHVPYIQSIFANILYVQEAFKELKQIKEWDSLEG